MNRKPIIIGNWKMNNGPREAHDFFHDLEHLLGNKELKADFAIAPPFISIPYMMPHSHSEGKDVFEIAIAAQNFHQDLNGAFTGEISLKMLEQLGVKYGIIGHSERRKYFNETDQSVNKKIIAALRTNIIPVVAFGETEEEFKANKIKEVVKRQLTTMLKDLKPNEASKIIFAYEPIWAIGTGNVATPKQAQEACNYSRLVLKELFGEEIANSIRIMYGGSVNENNIGELISQEDIDGALVGNASIDVNKFAKLVTYNLKDN